MVKGALWRRKNATRSRDFGSGPVSFVILFIPVVIDDDGQFICLSPDKMKISKGLT